MFLRRGAVYGAASQKHFFARHTCHATHKVSRPRLREMVYNGIVNAPGEDSTPMLAHIN